MEKFHFGEEECDLDMENVKATLFSSEDPASYYYKRVLIRPEIPWKKIILWSTGLVLVCVVSVLFKSRFRYSVLFIALYLVISLKWIVKTLIMLYQHYAPDHIRNRCRYEPSCSVYMQQAIDKYGLLSGMVKGIRRLWNCNHGGGGYDDP